MPTAFSYIRFSTPTQILGDSLRRQLEATKKWCDLNNITLSNKTFQDLGVSGYKSIQRDGLAALFQAIEIGAIRKNDYIVLENLDRLSRQGIDATQQLLRDILKSGVKIYVINDSLLLDESSLNDVTAIIRIALSADLGYQESNKKSIRVLAAKAAAVKRCVEGEITKERLPFWLSVVDNKIVFNEKLEIIQEILKHRKAGLGAVRIADILNEAGYKSPRNGLWKGISIGWCWQHVALFGRAVMRGVVIDNYYPAVLTYEQYKEFQNNGLKRVAGTHGKNHLMSIVKCHSCGGSMNRQQRKGESPITWACVVASTSKASTCNQTRRITGLDKIVFRVVKNLKIGSSGVVDNSLILLEIEKTEQRISELNNALISGVGDVVVLSNAIGTLKNSLLGLQEQIIQAPVDTLSSDIELLGSLETDPKAYNIAIRKVIKKIVPKNIGKNVWHIKIYQTNGHVFSVSASKSRPSEDWRLLTSSTEYIANIISE